MTASPDQFGNPSGILHGLYSSVGIVHHRRHVDTLLSCDLRVGGASLKFSEYGGIECEVQGCESDNRRRQCKVKIRFVLSGAIFGVVA